MIILVYGLPRTRYNASRRRTRALRDPTRPVLLALVRTVGYEYYNTAVHTVVALTAVLVLWRENATDDKIERLHDRPYGTHELRLLLGWGLEYLASELPSTMQGLVRHGRSVILLVLCCALALLLYYCSR